MFSLTLVDCGPENALKTDNPAAITDLLSPQVDLFIVIVFGLHVFRALFNTRSSLSLREFLTVFFQLEIIVKFT